MSVEDAHREHLLTEAMNRLKSDNEIVGFNHGTCELGSEMVMGAAGGASGYTNGGLCHKSDNMTPSIVRC